MYLTRYSIKSGMRITVAISNVLEPTLCFPLLRKNNAAAKNWQSPSYLARSTWQVVSASVYITKLELTWNDISMHR